MSTWWVPPTLQDYRASWLSADALAGLALVAVALPSQMATAQLANLPAVAGLYAFVAGSLLYAALGRTGTCQSVRTPPSPLYSPSAWRRRRRGPPATAP
jgi:MFS superfamily sulfate permease-like transporter